MKTIYVKDLKKNQVLTEENFAIFEVKRADDKNGKPYYSLLLGDKTGKVPAKIWSDNLAGVNTKMLKTGKLICISGRVDEFKGNLQINVQGCSEVDENAIDDFIEKSKFDTEQMFEELLAHIEKIENKELRKVLKQMFADDEFTRKYKYWPAGNSIHHGFRSGLLQHVLEMLNIADSLKKFFTELNYDVLKVGIILHDSGKLVELSGGLSSGYTKEGILQGHIAIGYKLFNEHAEGKINEDIRLHISHLILSHHGMYQYGSPVVPSTPEAIALYYIDGLSSKTRASLKAVEEIADTDEFGRQNMWLEGARFWKNHNKTYFEDKDGDGEFVITQDESGINIEELDDNGNASDTDQVGNEDSQIPLVT